MKKDILETCIEIVKDLGENDIIYFQEPLVIKPTPHAASINIWAIVCSPYNQLFVMDNNQEWHSISIHDQNASVLIGSLFQRLNLMRVNYAKAS